MIDKSIPIFYIPTAKTLHKAIRVNDKIQHYYLFTIILERM